MTPREWSSSSRLSSSQGTGPTGLKGRITHSRLRQQVAGLAVYGTYARASLTQDGRLLNLIENLAPITPAALVPPLITQADALQAVLDEVYPDLTGPFPEVGTVGNTSEFAGGDFFFENPTVTRVVIPMANGALHGGYRVTTWDEENNLLLDTLVGRLGNILLVETRTSADSYLIFPDHPGNSPQTLVSDSADPSASPQGWVTLDTTIGNNVDAYLDRDSNDASDGRPTSPTEEQEFVYPVDLTQDPTAPKNQDAAVTNLFYFSNLIHDRLHQAGFTEGAGNFQENNFNNGGQGGDRVLAEAQDGGFVNNANFATPPDGGNPRMQMYLWNLTDPWRDGDFDSDIIWHEYGHGLTWRMIGGMSGPLSGAIGEGMSDVLAIYMNNDDVVGEYSVDDPIGIRSEPYTNYSRTYGDASGLSTHDDGEIYAAAMWRLKEYWNADGRSTDTLLDLTVDGMNFTPSGPASEDMRDGIITAAGSDMEGACYVWHAFADFGIGDGASASVKCRGRNGCTLTVSESFSVPSGVSADVSQCGQGFNNPPTANITGPADGSSFLEGAPISFSGTANDAEDGDVSAALSWTSNLDGAIGTGGSFSTITLSVGTHTVTASVTDLGGLVGTAAISVTVIDPNANTSPTVTITAPQNGSTFNQGESITFSGMANDTEDGDISASLAWTSSLDDNIGSGASVSTTLSVGIHTVTAVATDMGGLADSDSITVTVQAVGGGDFTLSASGRKVRGVKYVDLDWSGTSADPVFVFRDGGNVTGPSGTGNDGEYTDVIGKGGGGSYAYKVCEDDQGATCSNSVTVVF